MTGSHNDPNPLDRSGDRAPGPSLLGALGLVPGSPTRTLSDRRLFRQTVMAGTDRMATVLDDVEVPGCRHRVDHVVIAPHGVWVVATVSGDGEIEARELGGFFRSETRLHIGGRDSTGTLDALSWQQAAVAGRLSVDPRPVPVRSALVVLDTDERPCTLDDPSAEDSGESFRLDGHRVTRLGAFGRMVGSPDPGETEPPLGQAAIARLAELLAEDPTAVGVGRATLDLTRASFETTAAADSHCLSA